MHTTTANTTQLLSDELTHSTRFVRPGGAGDALGFAQMMQAFDPTPNPTDTELNGDTHETEPNAASIDESKDPIAQSLEAEETKRADGDDEKTAKARQAHGSDEHPSETTRHADGSGQAHQANGAEPTDQLNPNHHSQSQLNADAQDAEESTVANGSALRLLELQSEQAKLSIKGVERSLTHAADVDLASIAVDTQLGRGQPDRAPSHTKEQVAGRPQPAPRSDPNHPVDKPTIHLPSTHPRALGGTQIEPIVAHPARVHPPQAVPVDAKADQSGSDAGQARSQRVDTANAVSQSGQAARSSTPVISNQQGAQLPGNPKASSPPSIRVVAGAGAGSVGDRQGDTATGSLIVKASAPKMPSETKRGAVLAQVQRGLASLLRSGNSEMTLKLTPANLGEVRIQLKKTSDGLVIRFETSTDDASESLNASVKQLGTHLRTKGINLAHIHIEQHAAQEPTPTNAPSMTNAHTGHGGSPNGAQDHPAAKHHQDQRRQEDTPDGGGPQPVDRTTTPESIWTDIGLDAVA